MAMVWIVRIINHRSETFYLSQNDPTYHPVIAGHQYGPNEQIAVPQGYAQDASWFVIPWAGSGQLELLRGPQGAGPPDPIHKLKYDIGPSPNDDLDHLRLYDYQDNQQMVAPVGPRGPNFIASMELVLVFNDSGIHWNVQNSNHIGQDILNEFLKIAESNAGSAITLFGK